MKKFIKKTILFLIPVLLLIAFGISPFAIKWQGDYLYAIRDKFHHLEIAESPKIILTGGSNLAFGMDSERLSEHYNMDVVNMGLHGSLGLRFMLEGVEDYVNEGDIVVIAPTYGDFFGSSYYGSSSIFIPVLFDMYPKGFKYLNYKQFHTTISKTIEYSMENINKAYIQGKAFKKMDHGAYTRNAFNEYGDVVAHWDISPSTRTFNYNKREARHLNTKAINELTKYILSYEEKGAKVIVLPAPIRSSLATAIEDDITTVKNTFSKNELPAFHCFNAEKYFFADSLTFDTPYHLLKEGVDIRTRYYIEDIDACLGF